MSCLFFSRETIGIHCQQWSFFCVGCCCCYLLFLILAYRVAYSLWANFLSSFSDRSLPIGDRHILGIFILIGLYFSYLFGISMCVKQVWLRLHRQSDLQLFKLLLWHECCCGSQRVRDVEWCRSFMAGALTWAELKQWLWVTVLISFRLSGHTSDKLKPFTAAPCPGRWM